MSPVLDWWWEQAKDSLAPQLIEAKLGKKSLREKTKKRTRAEVEKFLGKFTLYEGLFRDLLQQCVEEKVYPDNPLFITNFALSEVSEGLNLECRVYLMTKGRFPSVRAGTPDQKFTIVVSQERPTEESIQAAVEDRFSLYQRQRSREFEKMQGPLGEELSVEEGDVVVISTQPKVDGVPWTVGTLTKNRLRVLKGGCHPDEFRTKLLGLQVGNHHISFPLNDQFGKMAGKIVEMDLTIHSILTYALPDWSDEIAKECGYSTLEVMRTEVQKLVVRQVMTQWEQKVSHEVLTQLVSAAEFDELPDEWLNFKVNERYDALLRQCQGDEKQLFEKTKSSQAQILSELVGYVRTEVYQLMALWGWGYMQGIQRDRDTDLDDFKGYLSRVLEKTLASVVPQIKTEKLG